jgi:aarF domain-containing kinase
MLSPQIQAIMERVRFGADFMPTTQLFAVMEQELGRDWRSNFLEFESRPSAAASIGQVHRAKTREGKLVAVKVQYPGVAESIKSDLSTLKALLIMSKWLPKGLYLDRTIEIARKELTWEVDYLREAAAAERFRELLKGHLHFVVPQMYCHMSTSKVLVMEWMDGVSLDRCVTLPSHIRNYVSR